MRALSLSLTLGLLAAAGGCATQRQALDEAATFFHDDLRWGRLTVAETSVNAALRESFRAHHNHWGTAVRLMDMEIEGARSNGREGTLRVRVQWLRGSDSTDVRESVVEERWEGFGSTWRLMTETIIDGDPGLFVAPAAASAPGDGAAPPGDATAGPG